MKPFFESDETDKDCAAIIPFSSVAYLFITDSYSLKIFHSTSTDEQTVISYDDEDTLTSQLNDYKAYLEDQYHANHLN